LATSNLTLKAYSDEAYVSTLSTIRIFYSAANVETPLEEIRH